MFPIDLRALQELASRAVGFLAVALEDAAEDAQRGYLIEAMNALDDIEATLDMAFELGVERAVPQAEGAALDGAGLLGSALEDGEASLVA